MSKENTAVLEAPEDVTKDITGLDNRPENVEANPAPGSIADLLKNKKLKAKEDKPEPKKEKAEKTKLTTEQIDEKLKQALFGQRKGKDKPVEAEPELEVEEEVKVEAKEEPKPEPVKTKKTVQVKDRASDVAERYAELEQKRLEIERERLELEKLKAKAAPQQEPQRQVIPKELSKDEMYDLEVYRAMAKVDKKYAGLADDFLKVAKATADRKGKWEKDHPGEAFDPNDSEHDDFFNANKVDYDRRDYKRAEHIMATEGQDDPRIAKLEQENKEAKAKERSRELQAEHVKTWSKHVDYMIEAIDPEIVKLTRKEPAKLLDEYPVEGKEIISAGRALEVVSEEAHKILDETGYFEPQRGNAAHDTVIDIICRHEPEIAGRSRADRSDSRGRDFATWDQWAGMNKQQQAQHWHLGPDEVVDIMAQELSERVKATIEEFNKAVELKNKRAGLVKTETTVTAKPAREHRSPVASPGSTSRVTVDTSSKGAPATGDKLTGIIRKGLFAR